MSTMLLQGLTELITFRLRNGYDSFMLYVMYDVVSLFYTDVSSFIVKS